MCLETIRKLIRELEFKRNQIKCYKQIRQGKLSAEVINYWSNEQVFSSTLDDILPASEGKPVRNLSHAELAAFLNYLQTEDLKGKQNRQ